MAFFSKQIVIEVFLERRKSMRDEKLRRNVEFRIVYRRGKSFSNNTLVLYTYKNNRHRDINNNN